MNTVANVFLNWTGQLPCHNFSKELLVNTPAAGFTGRTDLTNRQLQGAESNKDLGITKEARNRKTYASPSKTNVQQATQKEVKATPTTPSSLGDINRPWNYQACTELILEVLTSDGFGFYVEDDEQIPQVEGACREMFGSTVVTRPMWMKESFGNGADLARSLKNVVFSDGEKDPWRVGGVPNNAGSISPDGSVVHILIQDAAHHQDLRSDDFRNPPSVVRAKQLEKMYIYKWLNVSRN